MALSHIVKALKPKKFCVISLLLCISLCLTNNFRLLSLWRRISFLSTSASAKLITRNCNTRLFCGSKTSTNPLMLMIDVDQAGLFSSSESDWNLNWLVDSVKLMWPVWWMWIIFRCAKGSSQKKITGLFGNFSQVADPPTPPFGNPLFEEKNYYCILGP